MLTEFKNSIENFQKSNHKLFAFDVDGTLVDDYREPKVGVVAAFERFANSYPNMEMILLTGASRGVALQAFEKINEKLTKKINPTIASFAGSIITRSDGVVLKRQNLTADAIQKIERLCASLDGNSIVIYCAEHGNYYIGNATNKVRTDIIEYMVKEDRKKGDGSFNVQEASFDIIRAFAIKNEIFTLEIVSVADAHTKVFDGLTTLCSGLDLKVSDGTTIQVSTGSKLSAINFIYGSLAKDAVYCGDGYNDEECMKLCELSFSVGKKAKVLGFAKLGIKDFSSIADALETGKMSEVTRVSKLSELFILSKQLIHEALEKESKK